MKELLPPAGQVLLYRTEDGRTKLDVRLEDETVWLSQRQLTDLFGKAKGTISEHIKHIFEDGELAEVAVVRFFRTTASDGKQYQVAHYNLDMVIALGFRVRSTAAVRFRQWAADKLKEYIVKGFVLDDERLKRTDRVADYFDELLARIREMADWEADLDKFLADTELSVLTSAGTVSHDEALDWAIKQYDTFAERRRVEAESDASARYLDDLAASAKLLERRSAKSAPKPREPHGKKGTP